MNWTRVYRREFDAQRCSPTFCFLEKCQAKEVQAYKRPHTHYMSCSPFHLVPHKTVLSRFIKNWLFEVRNPISYKNAACYSPVHFGRWSEEIGKIPGPPRTPFAAAVPRLAALCGTPLMVGPARPSMLPHTLCACRPGRVTSRASRLTQARAWPHGLASPHGLVHCREACVRSANSTLCA